MKIITAIGNEIINEKLKKISECEIIKKDLQYQEAVLEILEENKNIDLIIISNMILGELNFYEFIQKIKIINPILKIFIILEKENKKIIDFLHSEGIINIFFDNKTELNEIIEKIKEYKNNNIYINQKIINKNKIINNEKIKNKIIKINDYIKNKINKLKNNKKINNNKMIFITGNNGSGKSIFTSIFAKQIINKKILIIDYDNYSNDINIIFGIKALYNKEIKINKNIYLIIPNNEFDLENYINNIEKIYDYIIFDAGKICKNIINEKIIKKIDLFIFLLEPNLLEINKAKKELKKYIFELKINKEKINIIFNKCNVMQIDKNILKNIFCEFNILGKIKYNKNYNNIINKNTKNINNFLKKEITKIIKKII